MLNMIWWTSPSARCPTFLENPSFLSSFFPVLCLFKIFHWIHRFSNFLMQLRNRWVFISASSLHLFGPDSHYILNCLFGCDMSVVALIVHMEKHCSSDLPVGSLSSGIALNGCPTKKCSVWRLSFGTSAFLVPLIFKENVLLWVHLLKTICGHKNGVTSLHLHSSPGTFRSCDSVTDKCDNSSFRIVKLNAHHSILHLNIPTSWKTYPTPRYFACPIYV